MSDNYAMWGIAATGNGITLRVRVVPRASRNAILGAHDGATRIALTAPPVEGAANAALIVYLAEVLALPKRAISLVSGQAGRTKLLQMVGITPAQALTQLQTQIKST